MPLFERVLIANRGEIAVRIIRACRDLGIGTAAVYSEPDAQALHVRMADCAALIGPAPAAQSYLRVERLIAAAQDLGADAIHPGYGFLSENAGFARACAAAGLTFIGPPPEAIEAMGGKIGARALAQAAGVPVVPGYDGADQADTILAAQAEQIGFPLLIKASAGGGGKGMRVVQRAADFAAALAGARREAVAAFGDSTVFLERLILRPRHVEIQIIADAHSNVIHLGERECSIQRRHQKILEEAPSPALSPALRSAMGEAAVRVARAAAYVNAGTVEFVLDPSGRFYFLEMNTRLQVEHPVTELVTGLDLVQLQLAIAAGLPLPLTQEHVHTRGHAIEVRLYAEDPVTFLPAVGHLALFEPPQGPGVRVDAGLRSGDAVTVHYDPMIAKLIAFGADRPAAIACLRRALAETTLLGLTTNMPLLRAIAANPAFANGDTHTGFLNEQTLEAAPPALPAPAVLAAAALWELTAPSAASADPFTALWRTHQGELPLAFSFGPSIHQIRARAVEATWQFQIDGRCLVAAVLARGADELVLRLADSLADLRPSSGTIERFQIARNSEDDLLIAWRGVAYHLARPQPLSADTLTSAVSGQADLTAPMPGTLIKILVREGEQVREGQPLVVLEAMKMEHTVVAPAAGVVRRLLFHQGSSVSGGATLVELESSEQS